MEIKLTRCEVCGKEASDEKQKRKENWLEINGGCLHGISVWLEKPRKTNKGVVKSYMLTIGYQARKYDFCSIRCLVKALEGKESI